MLSLLHITEAQNIVFYGFIWQVGNSGRAVQINWEFGAEVFSDVFTLCSHAVGWIGPLVLFVLNDHSQRRGAGCSESLKTLIRLYPGGKWRAQLCEGWKNESLTRKFNSELFSFSPLCTPDQSLRQADKGLSGGAPLTLTSQRGRRRRRYLTPFDNLTSTSFHLVPSGNYNLFEQNYFCLSFPS